MKLPEEIKKGLEIGVCDCDHVRCCEDECPYERECSPGNDNKNADVPQALLRDALAYIRQLEAERDAAVDDLRYAVSHPHTAGACYACKHHDDCKFQDDCDIMDNDHWEWRGVQKEE